MEKELNKLFEQLKELKIYYKKALDSGNREVANEIKLDMDELNFKIKLLYKKKQDLEEIQREKEKVLKSSKKKDLSRTNTAIDSKSQRIEELQRKLELEKKKKELERKQKEEAQQREKKKIRQEEVEVQELKKKARLKELKGGTLAIVISLSILALIMLLRPFIYQLGMTFEKVVDFHLVRIYILFLLTVILIYTYVQEDIKRIVFIRIYSIITLLVAFISFGGLIIFNKKVEILSGKYYLFIPMILLLVLIVIFARLIVRDKLAYQYVKKNEEDEYYEDEYYEDEKLMD